MLDKTIKEAYLIDVTIPKRHSPYSFENQLNCCEVSKADDYNNELPFQKL
jgi:hypothetical protein